MPKVQSSRYVEVNRTKGKSPTNPTYWPMAAGTIVMMLAMAVVNHSGWKGHRSPLATFRIECKHVDDKSSNYREDYQNVICEVVRKWRHNDKAQNLQTLQRQIMNLGHFQSAKVWIATPRSISISVLTGERIFDVDPSFLSKSTGSCTLNGFVPWLLNRKTCLFRFGRQHKPWFSTAVEVLQHAKAKDGLRSLKYESLSRTKLNCWSQMLQVFRTC